MRNWHFVVEQKKNRTNFNDAPMAMTKKRNKPAKNIRKLLNRLWVRSITAVLITTVNHLLGDAVFLHLIIFVLILCHRQKSNLDSRFTLLLDLRVWFWSHFDCFCAILIYLFFFSSSLYRNRHTLGSFQCGVCMKKSQGFCLSIEIDKLCKAFFGKYQEHHIKLTISSFN